MARQLEKNQLELGQAQIGQIKFDIRSRDDIPKILKGLQYLYITDTLRASIFSLLSEQIAPEIDKETGRPGMTLWEILVLGVLRLDLNCDYDRLQELANQHRLIRKMLGKDGYFDDYEYALQTVKDNVRLLTPELLSSINTIIVKAGHGLVDKKKESEVLRGRCDSFVVETDVHYPTDIGLLYDAVRKVIQLSARLSERYGLSDWRQYQYNIKVVKRAFRIAQKSKRGTGKAKESKTAKEDKKLEQMKSAHQELLLISGDFLEKASYTIEKISSNNPSFSSSDIALLADIQTYKTHALRQIEQTSRRVLHDEVIQAQEKVYSIFEPHTEWIVKGKAGVPVELGLRVCIVEDQHQFILTHEVMEKTTDDQVAVSIITRAKALFPHLFSCSFDKGFHSPDNQRELAEVLEQVALRRKGKRSKKVVELESSPEFKAAHDKHSAVESAINALEVHGLDVCRDHGLSGFKRYVALAIVTRNIHRIGDLLYQKERAAMEKKQKRAQRSLFLLAA